jgi:hypothetical protein
MKAVEIERSVSDLVNAALRQSLAEDADDLAAFCDRAKEPNLDFEAVVKDLRRRGKLGPQWFSTFHTSPGRVKAMFCSTCARVIG